MKRLVLLIFSLFAFYFSKAQIINKVVNTFRNDNYGNNTWVAQGNLGVDTALLFNAIDTTFHPLYPGLVYKTSDNTLYLWNMKLWSSIGSSKIDTVNTIPQMELYSRSANLLFVTDSLRGGLFYYYNLGSPDGGVCFPATGKITGYWIRVFNQANGVNVAWFGANPYDAIADNSNINAAINSPYSNGIVNVNNYTTGQFYLDSAIVLKTNTSLLTSGATRFSLVNNADCYMLVNKNVYGADSNIVVKGGVWFGNGLNQSRKQNTDSIQYEYAGMILRFVNASNIYIDNVVMDTALSYTTWFPNCNNVHISNSECWGTATSPWAPGHTLNECFVGFSGNGLYLKNLKGHTADDFITIQSGLWGSIDSMKLIPQVNVSNVYADNINIVDLAGAHVYASFAAWAGENAGLPNSNVSNVYLSHFYGACQSAMFKFGNYPSGISNFNNINISDCNFTVYNPVSFYSNQGVVVGDISNDTYQCNMNGLYLNNIVENNNGLSARFLQFFDYTNLTGNVTLNNVSVYQTSTTNNPLAYSLIFDASTGSTSAYNLLLNNCKNFDNGLSTSQYLYYRNNVLNTYPVNITFSNCFVNNPSSYPFRCQNAASKISVNGTSLEEPISYVTAPSEGNVVNDPAAGYSTYLSGKWVQYLTGNQNITLSGDITGSGTTAITTSLKNTGTAGNYTRITFDAQGRETGGTDTAYAPLAGGSGYIQNQYAAAQPASWWVQGQSRTDGGTFNLTGLGNGKLISTSTLNLTDTGSYVNPANGIGMYAFNSGTELDNPHSITLSGGVNQIAGLRSDISLNSSDSTTWLNLDAGSAVTGLLGVIRAFNNGKYGVVGAVGALAPFTFTQAPYTAFTGHIDTAAQILLYKQTDVANSIDSKIGTPFGILQLSPYPNSFNGGLQMPIVNVSANYTATTANYSIRCTAALTLTLPAATSCPNQIYHIVSTSGTVTVTSFNNLSNVATTSIAAGSAVELQSDGTAWNQIGN
ncbi:MAG: hypothetical protein EPN37_15660 [Chitinophagaceae bacterium]|nr:MAG: hypothetical protein EPN37_15660 [Chitinophagaceae bacterium]